MYSVSLAILGRRDNEHNNQRFRRSRRQEPQARYPKNSAISQRNISGDTAASRRQSRQKNNQANRTIPAPIYATPRRPCRSERQNAETTQCGGASIAAGLARGQFQVVRREKTCQPRQSNAGQDEKDTRVIKRQRFQAEDFFRLAVGGGSTGVGCERKFNGYFQLS